MKSQILILFLAFILCPFACLANVTFADVALYVGQRKWSQSPAEYRYKSKKEILKKNSQFFSIYEVSEFNFPVNIADTVCQIGGIEFSKKSKDPIEKPKILFFYGNAMDSFSTAFRMSSISNSIVNEGYTVVLMDYPGYGLSECVPNESSVIKSSLAFLDLFTQDYLKKPIVIGYSLGGGVAAQVSKNRLDISKLILVSTFSNMHSVVDHLHKAYGTFKFKLASKLKGGPFKGNEIEAILSVKANNNYTSAEHIKDIQVPILLMHGTVDQTIPIEHFDILKQSLTDSKKCYLSNRIETVNHSGLFESKKSNSGQIFWDEILIFLNLAQNQNCQI